MTHRLLVPVVLWFAVTTSASAGQGTQAASTLPLHGSYSYVFEPVDCPSGTAEPTSCYTYSGHGEIRGLGSVSITFLDRIDTRSECVRDVVDGGSITTPHGSLIFSAEPPPGGPCVPLGLGTIPLDYTITSGTGALAGAAGGGTLTQHDTSPRHGSGDWEGTVSAPGYTFDLTPPVIHGAVAKSIAVSRRLRTTRVRFLVTAVDAVDGTVSAVCEPPSGSRFGVGRTMVSCTAGDASDNTARAAFTITVRRRSA